MNETESDSDKAFKRVLSTSHPEIIRSVWDTMGKTRQELLCRSVAEGVMIAHPECKPGPNVEEPYIELPLNEVIRAAWCLGFHYCMLAIENGALVKAGHIKPQNN